jgi:eukaryotic-like serine/threonine-protein kinase
VTRLTAALADRYRIERELGAGGMATVYLAFDIRHDRRVALKVLKPELAAVLGADRFVVEIRTTAALQHPHILPLFDSGTADGFLFYVMPFIDGETLRAKLDRETQLGIDEALRIATNVADALDYAHRHGVIHRDIKPENILLHEGRPMVADFGIALALSAAAGGRMTETGLSLGTPHYMSPEQATAEKEISARSDIYSLASVLFEMLAGQPPHTGASAQRIIMKIITEEPADVTALRRSVPSHVAAAIAQARARYPYDRRRWIPWSVAAAALLAASAGWLRSAPQEVSRFAVVLPEGQSINTGLASNYRMAVSPDGRVIAYVGDGDARSARRLWVRRLDELQATPLHGTDEAMNPAFSPDGGRIAFVSGVRPVLKWIPADGGPVTIVTDSLVGTGGISWGRDGFIYFAGAGSRGGILRVAATGGPSQVVAAVETTSGSFHDPVVLPNRRGVIFTSQGETGFDVAVIDTKSSERRVLVRGALGRFAASGHLVYVTADGTMMAAPFDSKRLVLTGDAVKLAERISLRLPARGDVGISGNGLLAYTANTNRSLSELVWVSRDGVATPVDSAWVEPFLGRAVLSPDGKLAAFVLPDPGGGSPTLWVKELDRGPAYPLGLINATPAWLPHSRTIMYAAAGGGMALGPADRSVPPTAFGSRDISSGNPEFSPDGDWIVYHAQGDIFAIRVDNDSTVRVLVSGPANETLPTISPDGRWLAYSSDESGMQTYVRPFPDAHAERHRLSRSGGRSPHWARDGSELYFIDDHDNMIAVPIGNAATFTFGEPATLFAAGAFHSVYEVGMTAGRFLMLRSAAGPGQRADDLIIVQGLFAELKARVK